MNLLESDGIKSVLSTTFKVAVTPSPRLFKNVFVNTADLRSGHWEYCHNILFESAPRNEVIKLLDSRILIGIPHVKYVAWK
jgi:hypothetical protein